MGGGRGLATWAVAILAAGAPAFPGVEAGSEKGVEIAAPGVPVRDDPRLDGWESEALERAVNGRLRRIAELLEAAEGIEAADVEDLIALEFSSSGLRPDRLETWFEDASFIVERAASGDPGRRDRRARRRGAAWLAAALEELRSGAAPGSVHVKFKTVRVAPAAGGVSTRQLVSVAVHDETVSVERHAEWTTRWRLGGDGVPLLLSIEVEDHEETRFRGAAGPTLFADCTRAVLGALPAFESQLLRGTPYWLGALEAALGTDVMGHSGVALGDVDGDGRDDLYLPQPGGLPNLLLMHDADGTVRDRSAESGADWLDRSHAALLVDLDNDGDQDLALATTAALLLMSNDGRGRFTLRLSHREARFAYSLAAADYDLDGDLDLYAARYGPVADDPVEEAVDVPNPVPYHDAENGAPNFLLRNDGGWRFSDATLEAGLDADNRRWSFAAAWEDHDLDGDPDLYVANDFGRNCLYRNDGGRFVNVAAESGVEDVASGMSVSWGDSDRDGWPDLYVGNMFSSAGSRITRQPEFQPEAPEETRSLLQRLARGNSLYRNRGDGTFTDVSLASGAAMGRWAWSSVFADLNNDGWEDLVVANGFLTAENPDDL